MRIYIRHADKQYDNGKSTSLIHDPGITDTGKEKCRILSDYLKDNFGYPKRIICSPYLRTRETVNEMLQMLNNDVDIDIEIEYDVRLSEYLGNRKDETLDVTYETGLYNPPHPELFRDMKKRVFEHNEEMVANENDDEPIWIVTHGLIISEIAKLNDVGFKKRLDPLEYIVIN